MPSDLGPYEKLTDDQKRAFFRNREFGLVHLCQHGDELVQMVFNDETLTGEWVCPRQDEHQKEA
jgi:hypothetical protein